MQNLLKLALVSILIGIVDAFFYLTVEFVDKSGTNYLWNELLNTDTNRILVVPVAIILSIAFSAIILIFKQKRIQEAETDLIDVKNIKPTSVKNILIIFIIGCTGLLAGASLGPEGVLVAITAGVGIWFAQKAKKMEATKLLVISSVGALLVGFFGSLLPILIPILILYKQEKKIIPTHTIPPILAGLGTYITLILIKGENTGFGSIPTGSSYNIQDIIGAFILGVLGAIIALLIKKLISNFSKITKKIDANTHWIISAIIFGSVIGILYFLGGQSIQFSGAEGTNMLLENGPYSSFILIGIIITKLLATAWSLPAGYRGGLVFPTIFIAVALSLIFTNIDPVLGGPGITIGAASGMMTAMLPPVLGFILILSIIPLNFIFVAVAGLGGAIIGTKITSIIVTSKKD